MDFAENQIIAGSAVPLTVERRARGALTAAVAARASGAMSQASCPGHHPGHKADDRGHDERDEQPLITDQDSVHQPRLSKDRLAEMRC
jgi:hypothetical protein